MINGHGDDLHHFVGEIKYNFSSNVYHNGCPDTLIKTLRHSINKIQNYPSPAANELNKVAAHHFKLNEEQFLFTNGATEAFYLIAQQYREQTATILGPTFSEYEDACKINQVKHHFISWDEITKHQFTTALVFICNPNNPNGAVVRTETLEQIVAQFPSSHFIIDEAYIEFTDAIETSIPLISLYKNISVVRSLTKTFSIPGVRLGYLISNRTFISTLLKIKMPWTVNSMAIEAGKFIFENYQTLYFNKTLLLKEAEVFKKSIETIDFMEVVSGFTTYFLVKLKIGTAAALKMYLAEAHQILIRDATNFVTLEGEHIRLSVQSTLANEAILKALKEWN